MSLIGRIIRGARGIQPVPPRRNGKSLPDDAGSDIDKPDPIAVRNETIIALLRDGTDAGFIAGEFGLHPTTVRLIARAYGVTLPRKRMGPQNAERDQQITADYLAGKSSAELGKLYGVSRERIRQILVRHECHERHFGIESPKRVAVREREALKAERRAQKERDAQRIIELYQQGMKYKDICAQTGKCVAWVEKILRNAGALNRIPSVIGKPKRKVTDEEWQQIGEAYVRGDDLYGIAAQFDLTPGSVASGASSRGFYRRRRILGVQPLPPVAPRPPRALPEIGGPQRQWSADELNTVREMYLAKASFSDIAQKLGRSRNAIAGAVNRLRGRAVPGSVHGAPG